MDDLDKRILNIAQTGFPLSPRPYAAIAERLGISEQDAYERVVRMSDVGFIRKIGPTFDTRRLGHTSTLVAMKVPPDRLADVAGVVSAFHEVTHNYGRRSEYNLWFTVVATNGERLAAVLRQIEERTGISQWYPLPAERVYKIAVNFNLR